MSNQKTAVAARAVEQVDVTKVALIRTKTGELRLFRQTLILSTMDKTLLSIPGMSVKDGDNWRPVFLVSAEGYKMQAKAASLLTINAPTVIVDGVAQPNPYMIRDERGTVKQVYCRAICFGFTPLGVPVMSDRTSVFDLGLYKLVDLLAKAKKDGENFRLRPVEDESPGKGWAKYAIDESLVLWVNCMAASVAEWMAQMVNRQRKAAEIAQTFAQRNAIKHHPCVSCHTSNIATTSVEVLSWIPVKGAMRWDMSQYEALVKQIAEASGSGQIDVGGDMPEVEVIRGEDAVHEDPETVGAEAKADLDEGGAAAESPDEGEVQDGRRAQLFKEITAMQKTLPKSTVDGAYKASGMPEGEMLEMAETKHLAELHKLLTAAVGNAKKGGSK